MKYIKKNIQIKDINAHKLRGNNFYKSVQSLNKFQLQKNKHRLKNNSEFSCLLCGGNQGEFILKWKDCYYLNQCKECSAISTNIDTFNSSEHVGSIYEQDYFKNTLETVQNTVDYRKTLFGEERYQFCIKRLNLSEKEISVLDVGCGLGYFLETLKDKGIKARGLEVDPYQRDVCLKKGLDVLTSDLSQEYDESYDLITLFDVLEHLTEPVEFFKLAYSKLKPGGHIIAFTPNINSFGFELMGNTQNLLYPFQHVCFYNPSSIKYLSEKAKLNISSVEYFGLDIMDYLLKKEYEDDYPYTDKLHEMMTLMQGCLDHLEIGNHMRITFQKK